MLSSNFLANIQNPAAALMNHSPHLHNSTTEKQSIMSPPTRLFKIHPTPLNVIDLKTGGNDISLLSPESVTPTYNILSDPLTEPPLQARPPSAPPAIFDGISASSDRPPTLMILPIKSRGQLSAPLLSSNDNFPIVSDSYSTTADARKVSQDSTISLKIGGYFGAVVC